MVFFFINSLLIIFIVVIYNWKINVWFISIRLFEINILKSKWKNLEEYWISNLNYLSCFCNVR